MTYAPSRTHDPGVMSPCGRSALAARPPHRRGDALGRREDGDDEFEVGLDALLAGFRALIENVGGEGSPPGIQSLPEDGDGLNS